MEKLDLELVIDAEGHLTEVGATALADGHARIRAQQPTKQEAGKARRL